MGSTARAAKALILQECAHVQLNTQFPSYFSVNVSKQGLNSNLPQLALNAGFLKANFQGLQEPSESQAAVLISFSRQKQRRSLGQRP